MALDKLSQDGLPPDALLSTETIAWFVERSPRTFRLWRQQGIGPKFIRIGKRGIRYRWGDWLDYINKNTVDPEATT